MKKTINYCYIYTLIPTNTDIKSSIIYFLLSKKTCVSVCEKKSHVKSQDIAPRIYPSSLNS
ncbi:MAG: hypothetical protein ACJAUL_000367 [Paraglaciecola sp.]|jgi:hypothetical protein